MKGEEGTKYLLVSQLMEKEMRLTTTAQLKQLFVLAESRHACLSHTMPVSF